MVVKIVLFPPFTFFVQVIFTRKVILLSVLKLKLLHFFLIFHFEKWSCKFCVCFCFSLLATVEFLLWHFILLLEQCAMNFVLNKSLIRGFIWYAALLGLYNYAHMGSLYMYFYFHFCLVLKLCSVWGARLLESFMGNP